MHSGRGKSLSVRQNRRLSSKDTGKQADKPVGFVDAQDSPVVTYIPAQSQLQPEQPPMAAAELARYAGLGQNPTRWQINQRAYRDLRPWGGFGPMPMPSLPSAELTRYEGIWTTYTPLQVDERTRRDLRSWGGFGPLPAATGISTAPVLELPYPALDQSDKRRRALLIPSDYKHRCPVCGKECSDAEDLGAHYLVSHRQDWHHFQKPCVQDACARNQTMPIEDFREHYEREHGVYVCLLCGGLESKSNETELADHKRACEGWYGFLNQF